MTKTTNPKKFKESEKQEHLIPQSSSLDSWTIEEYMSYMKSLSEKYQAKSKLLISAMESFIEIDTPTIKDRKHIRDTAVELFELISVCKYASDYVGDTELSDHFKREMNKLEPIVKQSLIHTD